MFRLGTYFNSPHGPPHALLARLQRPRPSIHPFDQLTQAEDLLLFPPQTGERARPGLSRRCRNMRASGVTAATNTVWSWADSSRDIAPKLAEVASAGTMCGTRSKGMPVGRGQSWHS